MAPCTTANWVPNLEQYDDPAYGDMCVPNITLDNLIHPLLHASNWEIYNSTIADRAKFGRTITPALRLASLFLRTETLQGWWLDTMTSRKEVDFETGIAVLNHGHGSPTESSKHIDDTRRREAKKELENSTFNLRFVIKQNLGESQAGCTKSTFDKEQLSASHADYIAPNPAFKTRASIPIEISAEHIATIGIFISRQSYDFAIHQYPSAPKFSQQVFCVQLAILILHELAHAVYRVYHPYSFYGEVNLEAFHSSTDVVPEMGYSYESWLFNREDAIHKSGGPLGVPMKWYRKLLAPERDRMGGMASWVTHGECGKLFKQEMYTGYFNQKRFLSLLDKKTWVEIRERGRDWFSDDAFYKISDLERFGLLEKTLEARKCESNNGSGRENVMNEPKKNILCDPWMNWDHVPSGELEEKYWAAKAHLESKGINVQGPQPDLPTLEDLLKKGNNERRIPCRNSELPRHIGANRRCKPCDMMSRTSEGNDNDTKNEKGYSKPESNGNAGVRIEDRRASAGGHTGSLEVGVGGVIEIQSCKKQERQEKDEDDGFTTVERPRRKRR
ncbi:hypothetical protein EJ08DRAFT_709101 [Tothia fuscella]|uniref:Uncharacterized protein n=1 Tax=Tothia fuscella TaxID=1048955 RepID=A0A9P4NXF8_9PEZI|nr:hypothetical protein EJ08DRAFT_709101 [Tothia fuscella]